MLIYFLLFALYCSLFLLRFLISKIAKNSDFVFQCEYWLGLLLLHISVIKEIKKYIPCLFAVYFLIQVTKKYLQEMGFGTKILRLWGKNILDSKKWKKLWDKQCNYVISECQIFLNLIVEAWKVCFPEKKKKSIFTVFSLHYLNIHYNNYNY